ncbi:MAG: hypothetical protein HC916_11905 [Coleofasciculaceae cyanobacterium SM2_1_6]|nr:hypothetical protein [Coleofasciculaceae cyanobacterium SM2_1_6]
MQTLTINFLNSPSFLQLSAPAIAHEVQVVGDVAGTWHVEPNHNPQAGEPALIWVALTKQGGEIVPLSTADCQMDIYRQPQTAADAPIVSPNLKAINVETYRGIPSAEVIFPQAGIYTAKLNCTPKNPADFSPLRMEYNITVAAGTQPPPTPVAIPKPVTSPVASLVNTGDSNPAFPNLASIVSFGGIIIVGLLMVFVAFRRQKP